MNRRSMRFFGSIGLSMVTACVAIACSSEEQNIETGRGGSGGDLEAVVTDSVFTGSEQSARAPERQNSFGPELASEQAIVRLRSVSAGTASLVEIQILRQLQVPHAG